MRIPLRPTLLAIFAIPLACGTDSGAPAPEDDSGVADVGVDAADDGGTSGDDTSDAADAREDGAGGEDAPTITDAGPGDTGVWESPYCPVESFSACGGEVGGRWRFLATCPEDPAAAAALFVSPYDDRPECVGGGNETIGRSTLDGFFEFADDGNVSWEITTTMLLTWVFDDTCLAAAPLSGATPEERCNDVANDRLACAYAPNACRCESDPLIQEEADDGTFTIDGMEIQLGEDPPAAYCIDGDSFVMDYYVHHPVSWRYWVLERE